MMLAPYLPENDRAKFAHMKTYLSVKRVTNDSFFDHKLKVDESNYRRLFYRILGPEDLEKTFYCFTHDFITKMTF